MRIKLTQKLFLSIMVVVCFSVSDVIAGVAGTAHDLSPNQDGSKACQYCHTPHMALAGTALWNHKLSNRVYEVYWSSSLDANVGQPTGSSKLCLSCHDGTVALDATITGGTGTTYMSPGSGNLGTDLSDDHPISFIYSPEIPSKDPQIRPPDQLPDELKLDKLGELQCMTCHDPHDDTFGKFLVAPNIRSNMCIQCHNLNGWSNSVHANSTAMVNNANDAYLRNTGYTNVADNGCLSCHQPHSAGKSERLFHFEQEENNCLSCHNGLVATTDLTGELNKASGHFVQDYQDIHDIKEIPNSADQHVECFDCHNSHAITNTVAQAPFVSGALKSVSGLE